MFYILFVWYLQLDNFSKERSHPKQSSVKCPCMYLVKQTETLFRLEAMFVITDVLFFLSTSMLYACCIIKSYAKIQHNGHILRHFLLYVFTFIGYTIIKLMNVYL
jgi:hypothetical protein